MPAQEFLNFIQTQPVKYELFHHEPIFSSLEADHIKTYIPGSHTKNLFLKDKKKNYFLVTVMDHKRVNLRELSKTFNGHLSFATADDLYEKMKVKPGSVTPFGLMHNASKDIRYILDQDILDGEMVNFHPLRNDMTVHISVTDFLYLITQIHCEPEAMSLPTL